MVDVTPNALAPLLPTAAESTTLAALEILGRVPDLSTEERLVVAAALLCFDGKPRITARLLDSVVAFPVTGIPAQQSRSGPDIAAQRDGASPSATAGMALQPPPRPRFYQLWSYLSAVLAFSSGREEDFARIGCTIPAAAVSMCTGSGDALALLGAGLHPSEGAADVGRAERLTFLALAAERGDWRALAEGFATADDDGRLFAAHLYADRCDAPERAWQLLSQAPRGDLLTAELLLDAAGVGQLETALVARVEALSTLAEAGPIAAATESALALVAGPGRVGPRQVHTDANGAECWDALQSLVVRLSATGDPHSRLRCYRRMLERGASPPVERVWRLREAQLAMACGSDPLPQKHVGERRSLLEIYVSLLGLLERNGWDDLVRNWLATSLGAGDDGRFLLWIGSFCLRRPVALEALRRYLAEKDVTHPLALALLVGTQPLQGLVASIQQIEAPADERALAGRIAALLVGQSSDEWASSDVLALLQQIVWVETQRGDERQVLERLMELLVKRGHEQLQVRVLERMARIEVGRDASALRDTLLRVGRFHREQGSSALLLKLATQLSEHAARDDDVLTFCEEVLREHGEGLFLLSLYQRRVEHLRQLEQPGRMVDVVLRQAQVEIDLIGDSGAAAASFKEALSMAPGNEFALSGLERVMGGTGQVDLAKIYEMEAERVASPQRAAELLEAAARLLRDQGRVAAANRLFEQAYNRDPTNPGAFRALEQRLATESAHRQRVSLWLNRADHLDDRRERAEALVRAAEIQEESGEIEQALSTYQKAYALATDDLRVVGALVRLYEAFERWGEFLEMVDVQISLIREAEQEAKLHFQYGSVLETVFDDIAGARGRYEKAIEVFGGCIPALHGLRDLAMRRDDWPEVVRTFERELPLWKASQGKASIHAHIGRIYNEKLGDRRKALSHFKKAITLDKGCAPAALSLFYLYADAGRNTSAAGWGEVCMRGSALRRAGAEEADFFARYAGVLAGAGQYQRALEVIDSAIDARVLDARGLWVLHAICRERPGAVSGAQVIDRCRELLHDDSEAEAILSACEGVLAESTGDLERALAAHRAAVSVLGRRFDVVAPLATLLIVIGEGDQAARLVKECSIDADIESTMKALNWLSRYELLHRRRPAASLDLLKRLHQMKPTDEHAAQISRVCTLMGDRPGALTWAEQAVGLAEAAAVDGERFAALLHRRAVAKWETGNGTGAELDLRRAVELAPALAGPYVANAHKQVRDGEHERAMRELKLAEQSVPGRVAEILDLQARLWRLAGAEERAEVLFRKAARSGELAEARLGLAHLWARTGRAEEAVVALRELLLRDATDLRVYHVLQDVWSYAGNPDAAKRAGQIVANAIGQPENQLRRENRPLVLRKHSWEQLCGQLASGVAARLFRIFCEERWQQSTTVPADARPVDGDVQQALQLFAPAFGVKAIGFWCSQQVPLLVRGNALLLTSQIERMPVMWLRPLLVAGLAAIRLEQQQLVGVRSAHLNALATEMSVLLDPRVVDSANLSRKNRRALVTLIKQVDSAGVPALETWLAESAKFRARLGLLFTGDFDATIRMAALDAGFGTVAGETVPFALLPAGRELAAYYVSSRYSDELSLLS